MAEGAEEFYIIAFFKIPVPVLTTSLREHAGLIVGISGGGILLFGVDKSIVAKGFAETAKSVSVFRSDVPAEVEDVVSQFCDCFEVGVQKFAI